MSEEFSPDELDGFTPKKSDGTDDIVEVDTDDVVEPVEDPNENKFDEAFLKDENQLYAPVDDDALEIQNYILEELYEE